ncbi:hypothetical protein HDU96_007438 [Phlyctochytrium bullatum]|nr:hypothetical protein HDU96_007438 [Phlyctochytrium bullatum]
MDTRSTVRQCGCLCGAVVVNASRDGGGLRGRVPKDTKRQRTFDKRIVKRLSTRHECGRDDGSARTGDRAALFLAFAIFPFFISEPEPVRCTNKNAVLRLPVVYNFPPSTDTGVAPPPRGAPGRPRPVAPPPAPRQPDRPTVGGARGPVGDDGVAHAQNSPTPLPPLPPFPTTLDVSKMRLRIQRCNLTTATVVAALVALLALLVGVEETASRAVHVSVYRRDAAPEALFAENARVEKMEAVADEGRRLERREPRGPKWDAAKIANQRAAVGGNAKALRGARRDARIQKNKGAKEKRAERAKKFKRAANVNERKRKEAYNKSVKNSRKNKQADKVINAWLKDPTLSVADKAKRKQQYRKFINHLKVDPANPAYGGHRYTPDLIKKLPAGTTATPLGPGRAQLMIPKAKGGTQIKSVFLAAGDYAGMGVPGLKTVSPRHGYTARKVNMLARQGLAQELQNPGTGPVRVVQQGGGYADISMKVYPPKNKGPGTAYPINRRR